MEPNNTLPDPRRQRRYLIGFLLCMLGVVGVGFLFLMPDATLEAWLIGAVPVEEEAWTGNAGGQPHIPSGPATNGATHNESGQPPALLPRAQAEDPTAIASASTPPKRHAHATASGSAVAALPEASASRLETLAARSAVRAPSKPAAASHSTAAPIRRPVEPAQDIILESGMGEITIVALMPGARVDVADYVVTEAPTTLRVPWPANYEMAVHMGDSTVYATRLHLSAENNMISFGVGAEAYASSENNTSSFVADASVQ